MVWPPELVMTINGVRLTKHQCETIRVAVGAFLVGLQREGLSGDVGSRVLMECYLEHAEAVFTMMIRQDRQGT